MSWFASRKPPGRTGRLVAVDSFTPDSRVKCAYASLTAIVEKSLEEVCPPVDDVDTCGHGFLRVPCYEGHPSMTPMPEARSPLLTRAPRSPRNMPTGHAAAVPHTALSRACPPRRGLERSRCAVFFCAYGVAGAGG